LTQAFIPKELSPGDSDPTGLRVVDYSTPALHLPCEAQSGPLCRAGNALRAQQTPQLGG